MLKRIIALMLALLLLLSAASLAEEDDLTDEQLAELNDLDAIESISEPVGPTVGAVYHEPDASEFNSKSKAIYTCKLLEYTTVYSQRSDESKRVVYSRNKMNAEILSLGTAWAVVRVNGKIGYVDRQRIYDAVALDPVNTPPYGVMKHTWVVTAKNTCAIRKSMSDTDDSWVVLNPGTMFSIWKIQDGWGIVHYWRKYGYVNLNDVENMIPVSPTDTPIRDDAPIAAYTSYYKMAQTEINKGRIVNIDVACRRLTRVLQPGQSLNFNKDVGPYNPRNGYQPAIVLVDGKSVKGYGGGTCQVSSTLYNALLQLPKIKILQRRPHGPGGASYLPHGMDAAVGTENLNLRFTNNYDFPIRVEGHTSNDGALLMLIYRAD